MSALINVLLGSNMRNVSSKFEFHFKKVKLDFWLSCIIYHPKQQVSKLVSLFLFPLFIFFPDQLRHMAFIIKLYAEDKQSCSLSLAFLMKLVPNSNVCQIILLHYDIKHGPAEVWLIGNDTFFPLTTCLLSRKLIYFCYKMKLHNPV
jgi:hypothetical protein